MNENKTNNRGRGVVGGKSLPGRVQETARLLCVRVSRSMVLRFQPENAATQSSNR